MCVFGAPKTPQLAEPKLPRQPIQVAKAASFQPTASAQIGFGQGGRSGARSLRIKRQRSDPTNSIGGIGQFGNGGALSIGAQVPA